MSPEILLKAAALCACWAMLIGLLVRWNWVRCRKRNKLIRSAEEVARRDAQIHFDELRRY